MSPVDYDVSLYAFLRGARSLQPPEEHWFREQLREINGELSVLSQLDVLDPRELELYELRAKYAAPSFPGYHLPAELILEIFICAASSSASSQSILDIRNSTPWIICRVCALWREIALNSTALWRTVIFSTPYPRHSVDILSEYLARSGEQSLTISLSLSQAHNGITPVLLRSCHRWKKVQIQVPEMDMLSPLLSIPGTLPQLEELYLFQTRPWYRTPINSSPIPVIPQQLLGAPLLRKLGIVEHRLVEDMLYLSPNLTHFSGYMYTFRQVRQLSSLPNLVECRMLATMLMQNESQPQSIVFPRLQRLSVDDVRILRTLVLPELNSFSLTAPYMSAYIPAILEDFLSRCPCTLLSITAPVVLLSVLQMPHDSLQSVRRLSMGLSSVNWKHTLDVLAALRSGVLPHLEAITLMVYGASSTHIAFEPLLAMISYRLGDAARNNNVQKLKSLRLCLCSVGVVEEMRRKGLARFELDGLVIEHNQSYGSERDWTRPWWFLEDDIPDSRRT